MGRSLGPFSTLYREARHGRHRSRKVLDAGASRQNEKDHDRDRLPRPNVADVKFDSSGGLIPNLYRDKVRLASFTLNFSRGEDRTPRGHGRRRRGD